MAACAAGSERQNCCLSRRAADLTRAPTASALCHAGVTTEEQLLSPANGIHPDAYMESLACLLEVKQPVAA